MTLAELAFLYPWNRHLEEPCLGLLDYSGRVLQGHLLCRPDGLSRARQCLGEPIGVLAQLHHSPHPPFVIRTRKEETGHVFFLFVVLLVLSQVSELGFLYVRSSSYLLGP